MPKGQKKNSKHTSSKKIESVYYFCAIIILISLTFLNIAVFITREGKTISLVLAKNPQEEIDYWETFLENYPTYKDGWIKLAQIEYSLGNIYEAKRYLQNAEKIDPSDSEIKNMKQKFNL